MRKVCYCNERAFFIGEEDAGKIRLPMKNFDFDIGTIGK
ncbi:hypothetical protein B4110_2513 [Parageobacillus toebii]|uniref:Uncharacterized protein n=1 Tax=Parageobacillus toebii TaxID=153151 RepID=A0A150MMV5_9BACL|nr:hypothetical protein B4110_2513 [Parageobacillus toebii]